jgi:hypothetical protein
MPTSKMRPNLCLQYLPTILWPRSRICEAFIVFVDSFDTCLPLASNHLGSGFVLPKYRQLVALYIVPVCPWLSSAYVRAQVHRLSSLMVRSIEPMNRLSAFVGSVEAMARRERAITRRQSYL